MFGSGDCALGFFDLKVASNSIEHSDLSLLDRCDGIVDGERSIFVQQLGIIRSAFNAQVVLPLGYFRLQIVHVSGDFRFHSGPLGRRRIASGLHVLIYLLDRLLGSSLRLRNASNDFIVRLLLCRRRGILGILNVSRQVSELFGKWLHSIMPPCMNFSG